jgi:hypothetical protein
VKGFSIRYTALSSGLEQLWFPAALWVLFAIVALVVNGSDRLLAAARAYLGCAVPLTAGVLAAYSVLDDPALELRFAAPVPAWRTLLERLGLTLAVQAICAGAFQALVVAIGGNLSILGNWGAVQLAWLVPCLALMATGCAGALAGRRPATGALAAGLIWLVELIARGSLVRSDWARYLLIFMGALIPDHPDLRANQWTLLALCVALFVAASMLLRRQERYL